MLKRLAFAIFVSLFVAGATQAQVAPTVASLKAMTVVGGVVDVAGYNAVGDGGGGRFYFDPSSATPDNGCTIFAPTVGGGRWLRLYSGPVNVDWCGANKTGNVYSEFAAAAAFPSVYVPRRSYRIDDTVSIQSGQQWHFDGSVLTHTVDTKAFFSAVGVDDWSMRGQVTMTGLLASSANTGEKALYVEAARRFRIDGLSATLFKGPAIHIVPGSRGASSFLGEVGQWSNIRVDQSYVGLQIDAGTAAEYQTFTNLNLVGNITGAQIAAGNVTINGGNIVKNYTNGLVLTGGSNNGHGIISGVNINHNGSYNIIADGVTNGFTLNGIHAYADSGSSGKIWFKSGATNVAIQDSMIDAPVVHDSTGTNRVTGSWRGSLFGVSGSNAVGLTQTDNY